MPRRPTPTGLAVRVRRGSLVGLALAMLALFAQIAAAMPLPPAAPGQTATVLGMAVPVCGLSHHSDPSTPGDRHDHLLRCASCLCCHAPAMLPAAAPRTPLPAAVVYVAAIVLPPATAPPRRLAARPPPRAPPSLERRPD